MNKGKSKRQKARGAADLRRELDRAITKAKGIRRENYKSGKTYMRSLRRALAVAINLHRRIIEQRRKEMAP